MFRVRLMKIVLGLWDCRLRLRFIPQSVGYWIRRIPTKAIRY